MTKPVLFYVRVSGSVIETLGLLLTAWRIYFRLKIGRFWWEDAWAVLLLLTGLLWITSDWIYLLADGAASTVAAWFSSLSFTCIVTFTRMSILFSIIRIAHGGPRLLKFTYACGAFFIACWVILIIEKVVECFPNSSLSTELVRKSICLKKTPIVSFELTTDCIAVLILVVLPLHMLWRIKLPRRQRRMILSIFASSVVLALGALFHIVGQILKISIVTTSGLHVEVALSIFVCNLLVVVTYTYRVFSGQTTATEDSDDDFTSRPRSPEALSSTVPPLTTVDLEEIISSQE